MIDVANPSWEEGHIVEREASTNTVNKDKSTISRETLPISRGESMINPIQKWQLVHFCEEEWFDRESDVGERKVSTLQSKV